MSAIVISRAELMTELQEISTDRDRLQNEYHKVIIGSPNGSVALQICL